MPLALARSAIFFPTFLAAAKLPPARRSPFFPSAELADTRVSPFRSSISWTSMWFNERYTVSRGRSEVPTTFLRIRLCTCRRFAFFDVWVSIFQSSVVGRQSSAKTTQERPFIQRLPCLGRQSVPSYPPLGRRLTTDD